MSGCLGQETSRSILLTGLARSDAQAGQGRGARGSDSLIPTTGLSPPRICILFLLLLLHCSLARVVDIDDGDDNDDDDHLDGGGVQGSLALVVPA